MTPEEIMLIVYNLALLPVLFFSVLFLILTLLNLFLEKPRKHVASAARPLITVQVPVFNDPIAVACVEACLKFAYPKDRYDIMILDDSTDPVTRSLMKGLAKKHPGRISYVHRENRSGYKPGALQAAMSKVKGEFIVIFDSDFTPQKDFLQRIVAPFDDKKVAIVQGRQGFSNKDVNLVSRFAAYTLMVYHSVVMPINDRLNTVFFCGTAGAIRRSALESVGGWSVKSVTEDSELSVRLLSKGFRSVYLPFETPSEVPITLEGFIKQQTRWCFGGVRVWLDHKSQILFRRGLTLKQRIMITYLTLGNIVAPAVILMTLAGFMGWFIGDPHLLSYTEVLTFFVKFFYTAGFLLMAILMLYKRRSLREFPQVVLATMTVGIVLSVANSIAVFRAFFMPNKVLFRKENNSWIRTEKQGSAAYVK